MLKVGREGRELETLDEIWADDLLGRRREAQNVVSYLDSVATLPRLREDSHGHVLAIDSSYGEGKTFFLRRLDRHLKATGHVSAYIDAWRDDLEDQPLVALASTLQEALEGWIEKPGVKEKLTAFRQKAGAVAKLAAIGLVKRGLSLIITTAATEGIDGILGASKSVVKDAADKDVETLGSSAVDGAAEALEANAEAEMSERIARFRAGQAAVQAMKDSLAEIVEVLVEAGMSLPVTIIVDELDRCRPTYAIKTLEEIKHLFDVKGVAFILGLHGSQLAHSVTAAYGASFDGSAYLRRFFNRTYRLHDASLADLVKRLITVYGIQTNRLIWPVITGEGREPRPIQEFETVLPLLLHAYAITARDVFLAFDMIRMALILSGNARLHLFFLVALIAGRLRGEANKCAIVVKDPAWKVFIPTDRFGREGREETLGMWQSEFEAVSRLPDNEISDRINSATRDDMAHWVSSNFNQAPDSYGRTSNYAKLLNAVTRFALPESSEA